jgi:WD40 repeat protein
MDHAFGRLAGDDHDGQPGSDALEVLWVRRRARLIMLGCIQPGLLAILVFAYFLIWIRPAPRYEHTPTWSTSTSHTMGIAAVAICPTGQRLTTGGNDGSMTLWEVAKGSQWKVPGEGSHAVLCMAFSPDGATLAVGFRDSPVTLYGVASGQRRATLRGHLAAVRSLAFSPDGVTLATGSVDGTIRLWHVASGEIQDANSGHSRPVVALSFAPDGCVLASGCSGGQITLWDMRDGKAHERPGRRVQREPVLGLAFAPDASILASGGASDGVKLWTVATVGMPLTLRTANHSDQAVAFSADGRALLAASLVGIIERWDVEAGRLQATARVSPGVVCQAISHDGRFFTSGGQDGVVRMWDLAQLLGSRD